MSYRNYKYIRGIIQRFNARNVRLYYPYWQYTDLFIFRFVLFESIETHQGFHLHQFVGII